MKSFESNGTEKLYYPGVPTVARLILKQLNPITLTHDVFQS
jgi:hypothetical protein